MECSTPCQNVIVKGWRVSADMAEQVEAPETLAESLDFIEAWEEQPLERSRPWWRTMCMALGRRQISPVMPWSNVMTAVQQGKEIDFQDEI